MKRIGGGKAIKAQLARISIQCMGGKAQKGPIFNYNNYLYILLKCLQGMISGKQDVQPENKSLILAAQMKAKILNITYALKKYTFLHT